VVDVRKGKYGMSLFSKKRLEPMTRVAIYDGISKSRVQYKSKRERLPESIDYCIEDPDNEYFVLDPTDDGI
jgi:hypothetical protein